MPNQPWASHDGQPVAAHSITVSRSVWDWLTEYGRGNASLGIRMLVEEAQKRTDNSSDNKGCHDETTSDI
jgi:hypothetical protein